MRDRRILGLLGVALAGALLALIRPFGPALSPLGHAVLAAVLLALGMWIFRPGNLPYLGGSAALLALAVAILFAGRSGLIDPATGKAYSTSGLMLAVTEGFGSSSFWTLIPALYFGFVLHKTGLGKRIAYFVLKSFPPSWASISLSWLLIGLLLSALTPSVTVRVAIVLPIALSIVDACRLEHRSRASAYVCFMAFGMAIFPGTGLMTGTLAGPLLQGFMPAELRPMLNFADWFRILCLPWAVVTVVYALLSYALARPKEAFSIPASMFREEYRALGPMRRDELLGLLILTGALLMFATERVHGLPVPATALGALLLLTLAGVIRGPEVSTGINWDVAIFFGVAMSLPGIFRVSGIAPWFAGLVGGPILGMAGRPLVFMLAVTLGLLAARFLDVTWGYAAISLTTFVAVPLLRDFGYHPLVLSMAYLAAIDFFLVSYHQPWLMMGESMIEGKGWREGHVALFGGIYLVSVIVSIFVAVPYWRLVGALR